MAKCFLAILLLMSIGCFHANVNELRYGEKFDYIEHKADLIAINGEGYGWRIRRDYVIITDKDLTIKQLRRY